MTDINTSPTATAADTTAIEPETTESEQTPPIDPSLSGEEDSDLPAVEHTRKLRLPRMPWAKGNATDSDLESVPVGPELFRSRGLAEGLSSRAGRAPTTIAATGADLDAQDAAVVSEPAEEATATKRLSIVESLKTRILPRIPWPKNTVDPEAETEPIRVDQGAADALSVSERATGSSPMTLPPKALASLEAKNVSAWFDHGKAKVLEDVSISIPAGEVYAFIGPSGCGKSTFLRTLNRMHEEIRGAGMNGQVLLDGYDIYDSTRKLTEARGQVGMVFQRPNPFPAMSIYDNVLAGLKLTGVRLNRSDKDTVVERSLQMAGLWNEVKDRLRSPGGSLSGGQQQRLCIARALAVQPKVLLMDEPCSALDPTSTQVIEDTMHELKKEVTIIIVTHNMGQAQRVSSNTAFFLATKDTPGYIVESGPTETMFSNPKNERTLAYVGGKFG